MKKIEEEAMVKFPAVLFQVIQGFAPAKAPVFIKFK